MSGLFRHPLERTPPLTVPRPWARYLYPPPAYPVLVKQATAQSGAASTTLTVTFASAPTSGNFLLLVMAGDKDTGAIAAETLPANGWTELYSLLSTSVSLYVWYKVSDGTETSTDVSWANSSAAGNTCWVGEYSQVGADAWAVLGSASNITDETNVTTKATGTTGSVAADAISVAAAAVDSSQSVTTVDAWGNSYSERYSATGFSGRGAVFVAELVTETGAQSSTFNYTGTADQTSAAVVVFARAGAAVGGSSIATAHPTTSSTAAKTGQGTAAVAQRSAVASAAAKSGSGTSAPAARAATSTAGTKSGSGGASASGRATVSCSGLKVATGGVGAVARSSTAVVSVKRGQGAVEPVGRSWTLADAVKHAVGAAEAAARAVTANAGGLAPAGPTGASTAVAHPVTSVSGVMVASGVASASSRAMVTCTGGVPPPPASALTTTAVTVRAGGSGPATARLSGDGPMSVRAPRIAL